MFLRIMDKADLCLEIFAPFLIPELAYMAASFSGLTTIPGLDDLRP
jgi:hypothetical protein